MSPPAKTWLPVRAAVSTVPSSAPEPPWAAVCIFSVYLFLSFSRAAEYTVQIPKLMLLLGLTSILMISLTSFNLSRLTSRTSLLLAAFTGIAALSIPFAIWRAAGVVSLYGWLANLAIFLAGVQVLTTPRVLRRALVIVAAGTLFLSVVATFFLDQDEARLAMPGTLGNSNDLAMALLFGLPCWGLILVSARGKPIRMLGAAAIILFQTVLILRTGSRGGLLALIAMLLIVWIRLPLLNKVVAAMAAALFVLILSATLPEATLTRYQSWSTTRSQPGQAETDDPELSAALRFELLRESLRVSVSHPLLGAGLGQFVYAANEEREMRGERALWKGAHNSFTQVSSELGIPALIIYCTLLLQAASASYRLARRGPAELRPTGWCVFCMAISYSMTSFFLNLPYFVFVPTLAALTSAIDVILPSARQQVIVAPGGPMRLNIPASVKPRV